MGVGKGLQVATLTFRALLELSRLVDDIHIAPISISIPFTCFFKKVSKKVVAQNLHWETDSLLAQGSVTQGLWEELPGAVPPGMANPHCNGWRSDFPWTEA